MEHGVYCRRHIFNQTQGCADLAKSWLSILQGSVPQAKSAIAVHLYRHFDRISSVFVPLQRGIVNAEIKVRCAENTEQSDVLPFKAFSGSEYILYSHAWFTFCREVCLSGSFNGIFTQSASNINWRVVWRVNGTCGYFNYLCFTLVWFPDYPGVKYQQQIYQWVRNSGFIKSRLSDFKTIPPSHPHPHPRFSVLVRHLSHGAKATQFS